MLPSIYKRLIARGAAYTVSRSVIRSFTGSSLVNLKATETTAVKRKVIASRLRIEKDPSIPVERRKLMLMVPCMMVAGLGMCGQVVES